MNFSQILPVALGYFERPHITINLFGNEFDIYYYALCMVSAFIACGIFGVPLFKKRGVDTEVLLDILIAAIPCAIIFARVWYVVFDLDQFMVGGSFSFAKALDIRSGGMAIHGGILGGALGVFIIAKIKKIKFLTLADFGCALLPLGQAIGRLGNFFNQEVYGKVTDATWFPYATYIEADGQYHVALCFHEMFFNLLLFVALYVFLMNYNGKRTGYVMGLYFLFYGLIRALMEPMRDVEFNMGTGFLGLPTMTWISILLILGGVATLTLLIRADLKENNLWWKTMFSKKNKQK